MKIRKVFIENYKVFKDFEINFCDENDKPLDIIVIAGINGSGKTTLLNLIVYCIKDDFILTNNDKHMPTIFHQIGYYTEATEHNENFTYLKMEEKKDANITNVKEKILEYFNKLIREKDIRASEVYGDIQNKIQNIFNDFNLQIEFSGLDRHDEVYFKNEFNDKIKIDELSTGEKELITKAFSLYLADIQDSVILIDEPETSLHPSWQNRILSVYEMIAKEKNNQIIIATHSPQIIASAKRESIRLLKKDGDKIEAYSLTQNPVSSDVNGVLKEIMEADYLPIELKEAQDRYLELLESGEVDTKEAQEELKTILKYESSTSKFLQKINFYLRHQKAKK